MLDDLAPRAGFTAEVAVLPISVAALMTPKWVARHLEVPDGIDRVILPGYCRGDLTPIVGESTRYRRSSRAPRTFATCRATSARQAGQNRRVRPVRHRDPGRDQPCASVSTATNCATKPSGFARKGPTSSTWVAIPGTTWTQVGDAVAALRDRGLRVSIDSFDPAEVAMAVSAGAELVLSVNGANRSMARDWGVEVVAIPDQPGSLDGLDQTIEFLAGAGVPFRIDPILEPIGFGFAASLERYFEVRRRYPEAAMIMGVGNLTELTDVDSAGVNTILAGLCQELKIQSVLTTAVINWARSSVRELDLARRLVHHAVTNHTLPKHVEPRLVALRDPKVVDFGADNLAELQRRIRDPNWRIFAEERDDLCPQ